MTVASAYWLLLVVLPMVSSIYFKRLRRPVGVRVSSILVFTNVPPTWRVQLRWLPLTLRWTTWSLLAAALASPACRVTDVSPRRPGLDLLLLLDVSQSMRARDVLPDRLAVARTLATRLIAHRQADRIGLVLFAGADILACPFTADHRALVARLAHVEPSAGEGTALGAALVGGLERFKAAGARRGAIVVLSDGGSAVDEPASVVAASRASSAGPHIMTVLIGATGRALYPTEFGLVTVDVETNPATLSAVAAAGRGVFLNGDNPAAIDLLDDALGTIERDEAPMWLETRERSQGLGGSLVVTAAALIALEWWLSVWVLRVAPLYQSRAQQCVVLAAFALCVATLILGALSTPEEQTADAGVASVSFVLDVSRSMTARDLGMSRRQAAVGIIANVARTSSKPIAIVAFAGSAEVVCPATRDLGAIQMALADVDATADALEVGSALAPGVSLGLQAIAEHSRSGSVIVLSDGEETTDSTEQAIAAAGAYRVPIHAVGLGTAQGESMSIDRDGGREQRTTSLDEARLRRLAERTGGRYLPWGGSGTTDAVLALLEPVAQRRTANPDFSRGTRLVLVAVFLLLLLQFTVAMRAMTER